jgi:hypothetical protein
MHSGVVLLAVEATRGRAWSLGSIAVILMVLTVLVLIYGIIGVCRNLVIERRFMLEIVELWLWFRLIDSEESLVLHSVAAGPLNIWTQSTLIETNGVYFVGRMFLTILFI